MGRISTAERNPLLTRRPPVPLGADGVIDIRADAAPDMDESETVTADRVRGAADRTPLRLRTVVMVGTNDDALALWTTLDSEPELGYRVGAIVGEYRQDAPWEGLPVSTEVEDLGALAHQVGANGVIVVGSALGAGGSGLVVDKALAVGLHLQLWMGLSGLGGRRVRLAPVSGLPFLYIEPFRGLSRANEIGKRAMDLILGYTLCLLTLPLLIVAAVLVQLEDRCPVIYPIPITVFKLRTTVSQ